jgi:hypothetical protein
LKSVTPFGSVPSVSLTPEQMIASDVRLFAGISPGTTVEEIAAETTSQAAEANELRPRDIIRHNLETTKPGQFGYVKKIVLPDDVRKMQPGDVGDAAEPPAA